MMTDEEIKTIADKAFGHKLDRDDIFRLIKFTYQKGREDAPTGSELEAAFQRGRQSYIDSVSELVAAFHKGLMK
jgi:hypothetical protein